MTDEPALPSASPEPAAPPPERERVERPLRGRADPLPLLYLVGFLVLAGTLFFLYRNPPPGRLAPEEANRVEGLQAQVQSLQGRVAELQRGPAAGVDLPGLQDRVTALEGRPAAAADAGLADRVAALEKRAPVELGPLTARVDALEKRAPADLAPLSARVDALEKRAPVDLAPLTARVEQLAADQRGAADAIGKRLDAAEARVGAVEGRAKQIADAMGAIERRAQLAARLQGASAALAAGQKLGDIPGAPPALARFASQSPPTQAGLRQSFETYAAAAQKASQPAIMENQDFGARLWNRAQQVVTVRQGDRVLLGDPIAGVIGRAREVLDAGDLAGAVQALDGLAGPAAAAMQPWTDQARALLDARAAIASMAAG